MDARAVTSATAPPLPPAAKPSASTPAPPSTRGSAPTGGASAEESQFDADVWERLYRRMAVTPEPEPAERTVAPVTYILNLRAAEGVRLPAALRPALADGAATLSHRLLFSLFDREARAFFGRTWEGPEEPLEPAVRAAAVAGEPFTVPHDIDAFFHSRLRGSRYVAAVETVFIVRADGGARHIATEHSAGWCTLEPFNDPEKLADYADAASQEVHRRRRGRAPPALRDVTSHARRIAGAPLARSLPGHADRPHAAHRYRPAHAAPGEPRPPRAPPPPPPVVTLL